MRDENAGFKIFIALVVFLLGFLAGCLSVHHHGRWKTEAIERGFAEYNQVTGEWQWRGGEE